MVRRFSAALSLDTPKACYLKFVITKQAYHITIVYAIDNRGWRGRFGTVGQPPDSLKTRR
jgi:hypothetical protein